MKVGVKLLSVSIEHTMALCDVNSLITPCMFTTDLCKAVVMVQSLFTLCP